MVIKNLLLRSLEISLLLGKFCLDLNLKLSSQVFVECIHIRCQANWLKLFRIVTINQVIKKILVVLLFLFFSFKLSIVLAAEEQPKDEASFATSYDVLYDVGGDGVTTVTEKITLRNLTSQYFANQFKMTIGATSIFDIKASDPGGLLEVSSEQKDTSTTINVKFNQQVAGLGKTLP